jgi:hypothetical protein
MARKVVDVGAPAYMGQYAALMVLLLAFFIVLVSLSQTQEAGFKSGIGEIKNALGLAGGYGFFNFAFFGRSGGNAPNPHNSDQGEMGIHKSLQLGDGGSGDTDLETKTQPLDGYITFKLPLDFPKNSDKPTPAMVAELKKIGLGFSLFGSKVQIRCFSSESPDPSKNRILALSRAAQIMKILIDAGVDPQQLDSIGYSGERYLNPPKMIPKKIAAVLSEDAAPSPIDLQKPEGAKEQDKSQGAYFYVFVKNIAKLEAVQ